MARRLMPMPTTIKSALNTRAAIANTSASSMAAARPPRMPTKGLVMAPTATAAKAPASIIPSRPMLRMLPIWVKAPRSGARRSGVVLVRITARVATLKTCAMISFTSTFLTDTDGFCGSEPVSPLSPVDDKCCRNRYDDESLQHTDKREGDARGLQPRRAGHHRCVEKSGDEGRPRAEDRKSVG